MTGFTMNQLRNWRIPARHDTAPFGYIQIGAAPYYRKAIIKTWLDRNNGGRNIKVVELGLDKEFAIDEVLATDIEKQNQLNTLLRINTANQFLRWSQTISDTLGVKYSELLRHHALRLYAMHKALTPEQTEALEYATRMQAMKDATKLEQYYVGGTLAHRRMWADIQGWNISDADIISLPVGDVPPIREVNK
jgi:hypothetical protein